MDINHLTLLTDLYELTMMQGYFKTGNDETVVFDVFTVIILLEVAMRSLADSIRSLIISKTYLFHMMILIIFVIKGFLMKIFWNILLDIILQEIFMQSRKELLYSHENRF